MTPRFEGGPDSRIDLTASGASDRDDPTLVRAVADGEPEALAELYERHSSAVRGLARRLCGPDRADDVAQEVFSVLWQRAGAFDPDRGSLRGYLMMMTHGRAVSLLRAEAARRNTEAVTSRAMPPLPTDPTDGIGDPAWRMLSQLPASQREAIALAYFVGYSYREVARVLDQSEGTVKARIRAGLGRLRRLMAAEATR